MTTEEIVGVRVRSGLDVRAEAAVSAIGGSVDDLFEPLGAGQEALSLDVPIEAPGQARVLRAISVSLFVRKLGRHPSSERSIPHASYGVRRDLWAGPCPRTRTAPGGLSAAIVERDGLS